MATWPTKGQTPYGDQLKAYIDENAGTAGDDGWTPVLALATDGNRVVQKIVDWVGGQGTKPSVVDQYVGPTGIVSTPGAAVDVRGAAGADGIDGEDGSTGPANTLTKGTITTGAPGTPADISITGTAPNQVLNMTIPEGDPGFTGVYGAVGTVPGPYPDGTVTFEY